MSVTTSPFPRRSHAKDNPDGHYEKSSHQGGGNNVAEDKENGVADKVRVVADESDNADEGHIAVNTEVDVFLESFEYFHHLPHTLLPPCTPILLDNSSSDIAPSPPPPPSEWHTSPVSLWLRSICWR